MQTLSEICVRAARRSARSFARFKGDQRANVAILFALLSPILVGGVGLGMETTLWYADQRNMQNAADAAVIAASTNGTSSYNTEASAVAAQYGYTNGVNGVTVASSNAAACPSGGNTCYSVSISMKQQLYLLPVVGFSGNTTISGQPAQTLAAAAVATIGTTPRSYCVLALATSGTALRTNGAPKADLTGCNTMSNAAADCNGHDLSATYGDAHLTDSGCGLTQESNVPVVSDPYAVLASSIPANTCAGTYPQEPAKKNDPALPASNLWTGSKNLSGNVQVCGDLQLTGNVTINAASGAVLVIENGQLDTNGFTIQTANGSAVTIIFSGTNSGSYTHAPTGGGTINIQAPSSGTWSGVAIYQDPAINSGVAISAAGNSPTWDITGLVYLPNSDVTFSGAVNKSSNGQSCFVMVVNTLLINGTGSILSTGGCGAAGLNMPTGQVPGRGQLVN